MAIVRELITKIGFQVDDKKLKKGEQALDRFKKTAIRVAKVYIAGKFVQGIGRAISETIELGNQIDKTSQKMGVSAREFQELQFAAQQNGVSFDVLKDSFKDLRKNAGEARLGNKLYKESFDRLGVSLTDSQGRTKPLIKLYKDVIDGLNKIPDPTARAAIGMKIMGESTARTVPLMKKGSKGLEDMANKAEELGLIVNDKTVKAAAAAADSFGVLNKVVDNIKVTLAAELLPEINKITSDIIAWWKANKELVKTKVREWAGRLWRALKRVGEFIKFVIDFMLFLWGLIPKGLKPIAGLIVLLGLLKLALGGPAFLLLAIGLAIQDLYKWMTGGKSVIGDWIGSFDNAKKVWEAFLESIRERGIWDTITEALDTAIEYWKEGLQDFANWLSNLFGDFFLIKSIDKKQVRRAVESIQRGRAITEEEATVRAGLSPEGQERYIQQQQDRRATERAGFTSAQETKNVNMTLNTNIQAPTGNAQDIAQEVQNVASFAAIKAGGLF